MMHRYLVFSGNERACLGGADDFIDGRHDLDAAKALADKCVTVGDRSGGPYGANDWAHVFDTETLEQVYNVEKAVG